jgi:DNA mismatch repair protein MSH5
MSNSNVEEQISGEISSPKSQYHPDDECIISIIMNQSCNSCGISIYNSRNSSMTIDSLRISVDSIIELLDSLKMKYEPNLFLIHPNIVSNTDLLTIILRSPFDNSPDYYRYRAPKSQSWQHNNAIELLCSRFFVKDLILVGTSTSTTNANANNTVNRFTKEESYHRIASVVDLQNIELCQAVGSLLTFMLSNQISVGNLGVNVDRLLTLDIQSNMIMDADTIKALSIFVQEVHPNVLRGQGRGKEGLSLFSLLDRTRSSVGKQRLKEWMHNPFNDIERIQARLDGVELITRTENVDWAASVSKILRKLHDIPKLLSVIKKAESNWKDWVRLLHSMDSSLALQNSVQLFISNNEDISHNDTANARDANFLRNQWENIDVSVLRTNLQTLSLMIDIGECQRQEDIVVMYGWDETLDRLRDIYQNLEGSLREVANEVLAAYPTLEKVGVEYVPQTGFLVSVEHDDVSAITEINNQYKIYYYQQQSQSQHQHQQLQHTEVELPFEKVYVTDTHCMYRNYIACTLDESIGDIRYRVQDRQNELLVVVEDVLLVCENQWRHIADCAANLDAIMSLGVISRERGFIRPNVVSESVIAIQEGRHPLQELTVDSFISNDTYLTSDKSVGIITGPVSSGKSVYLKQIGLIVYMTHIGCFVPCKRAVIGLCDKLLTRVNTVESSTTPQSAFTLDLCQMSRLLKAHTSKSLCLVDEFGKGTSPVDALSLLASTIEHFCQPNDNRNSSRCLFALHYTEVLSPGIIAETSLDKLLMYRMTTYSAKKVELDTQGDVTGIHTGFEAGKTGNVVAKNDIEEDEVPMFKLEVGISAGSLGISCAKRSGVAIDLVTRAYFIRDALENHSNIVPIYMPSHIPTAMKKSDNRHLLSMFLEVNDWSDMNAAPEETLHRLRNGLQNATKERSHT